ncbi:MAG: hypothetical protein L0Z70_11785 [Chloroflexi bacterium]|nr:hypothetical protein [Chloroflexota bacterium]
MFARLFSLCSLPLLLLALWGVARQINKEQRLDLASPLLGVVMAALTLGINLTFLSQASLSWAAPMLGALGLGFGLAWGQTTRLQARGGEVTGKQPALHLLFWGLSLALTQLMAAFLPAAWTAGGLALMFFTTGITLGINLNLLARQLRLRAILRAPGQGSAPLRPPGLPERKPPGLPERNAR